MADLPAFDPQDDVQVEVIEHAPPVNERSVARRLAVQIMYEIDAAHHPATDVIARHLTEQQPVRQTARYVQKLVMGVLTYQQSIDNAIVHYAPDFPLDQIAIIDRNVLRLAIYEFAVSQRVPVSAAINEAVELAKLYGSEHAPAFVNGVLGAVAEDEALMHSLHQASETEET